MEEGEYMIIWVFWDKEIEYELKHKKCFIIRLNHEKEIVKVKLI